MSIEDLEQQEEYLFCPECGSKEVVVELKDSYFCVSRCHKCGYRVKGSCFNTFMLI